jgi:hypothetical protein
MTAILPLNQIQHNSLHPINGFCQIIRLKLTLRGQILRYFSPDQVSGSRGSIPLHGRKATRSPATIYAQPPVHWCMPTMQTAILPCREILMSHCFDVYSIALASFHDSDQDILPNPGPANFLRCEVFHYHGSLWPRQSMAQMRCRMTTNPVTSPYDV